MAPQAISDVITAENWCDCVPLAPNPDPRKRMVGFDLRFLSDRYAQKVAPKELDGEAVAAVSAMDGVIASFSNRKWVLFW